MLRLAVASVALALLAACSSAPTSTGAQRNFPADALRGDFMVTAPPQVSLNGRLVQLAPGARIRGTNNLLQLSGPLVGQRLLVNFTVDTMGFVRACSIVVGQGRFAASIGVRIQTSRTKPIVSTVKFTSRR